MGFGKYATFDAFCCIHLPLEQSYSTDQVSIAEETENVIQDDDDSFQDEDKSVQHQAENDVCNDQSASNGVDDDVVVHDDAYNRTNQSSIAQKSYDPVPVFNRNGGISFLAGKK